MHQKLHLLFPLIFICFSFGSSFKNEIVRRVPEDCSDYTYLTIDEIRTNCVKNSGIHFVIYGNHSMSVKVETITRDHFPVVRLRDQPQQIDFKMRSYLSKCQILDKYVFNEFSYSLKLSKASFNHAHYLSSINSWITYSFFNVKNKSDVPFIGLNNVWLGCPQQLCLSARIDAATLLTNGTAYVFRGNYYWDLKSVPLVGRAHKITEWNKNINEDNGFNLGYFDAIVTSNHFTSFYRNDRQYIWDFETINENFVELDSKEFQYRMDSSFAINNHNQSLTYDIRGQQFVTDKNPFTDKQLKDLGIPWDRVDAAFARNNTIYLFKDWYYLKLSENESVPAQSKLVFEDIYNCPSSLYDMFGGYQLFLKKIAAINSLDPNLNRPKNVFNETIATKLDDIEYDQTLVAIILLLITISIIILIIIRTQLKTRFNN